MNSFGTKLRIEIFGGSHEECVGIIVDGVPAGIPISETDFENDIERRRPSAYGTTSRKETDKPIFVSGVTNGYSDGEPITISFKNENIRTSDYNQFSYHYRPSHVDFVALKKYGGNMDISGGGMFSGRMTLPLVAAGVIAKKLLADISINAYVKSIGGVEYGAHKELLEEVVESGDSIGGIVECKVDGLKVGYGEPFFDSIESVLSHLIFSIPAIKGVEFGSGFEAARMRGSEHNDVIVSSNGKTLSNHAGGIVGGISNGNQLIVRVAVKPTASISRLQNTWNEKSGRVEPLLIKGRHDSCIALRVPVVLESVVAIALAQFILD